MNEEKNSADEKMTRRFYFLNVVVTVLLLFVILMSIYQFGENEWSGQKQVALILPGVKDNLGWDRSQFIALKKVCAENDALLVLRENIPDDYESCKKVVDELAKRGVNTICFTNGCKLSAMKDFEKIYPRITFCTIETISALWNGGVYSILSFEGYYLAGIVAGLHTKTNKIGYIAPYSNSEVNQNINAFALGVQRVNPDAEVLLDWTGSWDNPSSEEQAVQFLKARHVDVLTYNENGDTVPNVAERSGIYFIAFNEVYPDKNYYLSAVTIDWQKVYNDLLRYQKTSEKNLNHVFGMSSQVIDFKITDKLSTREKILIETAKWEVNNGRIIFSGDIFDRHDVKRCSANETINFHQLQKNMNWLIKGVTIVGS